MIAERKKVEGGDAREGTHVRREGGRKRAGAGIYLRNVRVCSSEVDGPALTAFDLCKSRIIYFTFPLEFRLQMLVVVGLVCGSGSHSFFRSLGAFPRP